jgi:hypothetical protein
MTKKSACGTSPGEARLWAESVYGAGTTFMFEDTAVAYLGRTLFPRPASAMSLPFQPAACRAEAEL